MLIGGDGISNVITLGTCFSMFVYIRTRFRITLIGGNVTAQSTESQGNWRWTSNSRDVVASSSSFSCLRESLLAGYPARGRSCGRLFSKLNHCELIPTTVVICVNPFSPKNDQYQFSPYNINTFSGVKVQRIYKIIAKEAMLSSFIFSSPNGSLKNDMVWLEPFFDGKVSLLAGRTRGH